MNFAGLVQLAWTSELRRPSPVVVGGIAQERHAWSLVIGEVPAGEVAVLEVRLDAMVEAQSSLLDQIGAVER